MALWSLDDYWYYALFTLVMLVLFEAMLCLQRQKNLEMLRSMRREPILVYVLRGGRWQGVSSESVSPGEVVSLVSRPPTVASAMREMQRRAMRNQYQQQQRRAAAAAAGAGAGGAQGFPMGMRGGGMAVSGGQPGLDQVLLGGGGGGFAGGGGGGLVGDDEAMAPFDVLLMRGSCVVNEAMLTGESVPQAKTSLLSAGGGGAAGEDAWVKVEDGTDSPHRKHVIFSGTKVRLLPFKYLRTLPTILGGLFPRCVAATSSFEGRRLGCRLVNHCRKTSVWCSVLFPRCAAATSSLVGRRLGCGLSGVP